MATYTPIEHGKPNWDKDLNDNFAKIFGGGATDDSGWVDCATLLNGAQIYSALGSDDPDGNRSSAIKRRVLDFHKFKIVFISGAIGFVKGDNIPINQALITVPSGYSVAHYQNNGILMPGTGQTMIRWYLNSEGTILSIQDLRLDSSIVEGNSIWLPINLVYISN